MDMVEEYFDCDGNYYNHLSDVHNNDCHHNNDNNDIFHNNEYENDDNWNT